MNIETLVSTMNIHNKEEYKKLIKKMNLKENFLVINQCPNADSKDLINIENGNKRLLSYNQKGLSKSRNKAIENSNAEICVIADDDLKYVDNYEQIIKNAYDKYQDADIIAFYVQSTNTDRPTRMQKEGRIKYIKSMKIASFQITFKKDFLIKNGIKFNENFGAGSDKYIMGEENILLFDCLRKKCKMYFIPTTIASVSHEESTWFKGYNKEYFITKGACFYKLSKTFCNLFIIQFALRKYKIYKKEMSFHQSIKYMLRGKRKIRANVFMVGDFITNTGPANVNKNLKKCLPENTRYSNAKTIFGRIAELLIKTLFSDAVCFCSFSKINVIGIKFCKLLNKKTFYIMHGHIKHENKINNINNNKANKIEDYILNNVTKVLCVSKCLKKKMEKFNYNTKFDYVYNGIDWNLITSRNNNKKMQIMSTGGDMPRKNNLIICKAINEINKKRKEKIKYIVAGKSFGYKEDLLKYDFVEYFENLNYEECLKKMSESKIYIQNSSFETFGLAVIESLASGCNLLISKEIGCIDIIETINNNDIIFDNNDIYEIVNKINTVMKKPNNKRLISGIDKNKTGINYRAEQLLEKIKEEL